MKKELYLLLLPLVILFSCNKGIISTRYKLDLAGIWEIKLDTTSNKFTPEYLSHLKSDSMFLPGTTDIAMKGYKVTDGDKTFSLSRKYEFEGRVIYSKDIIIPEYWKNKDINLILERTKPTILIIDGKEIGHNDNICTSQVYNLTPFLNPGKHKISIIVDNSKNAVPKAVFNSSHAYSSSTQTNWNGIIGEFYLECRPQISISDVQIYPNVNDSSAELKVTFHNIANNNYSNNYILVKYYAEAWNTNKRHKTKIKTEKINIQDSTSTLKLPFDKNMLTWSEFNPALYKLFIEIEANGKKDIMSYNFGMRDFKTNKKQFTINNKTTYLRGKHDACVFPLTAHTAMDIVSWRKYFQILKDYGINHCRFHSWCPPKACFEAADIEGIYLQPELPIWGNLSKTDSTLCNYLLKEGDNILKNYSNYPSFVMLSIGNELRGKEVLINFVNHFKSMDSRHIYSAGSNNFLGANGNLKGEDFYTTCRIGITKNNSFKLHTRASFSFADAFDGGLINHTYPNSIMNFEEATKHCNVPIIGHETGQYQIYPNYNQIDKYTGVLVPLNLKIFKERLNKAGMGNQAEDFFKASGKWAAKLYRADMEMNFRTPEWGGFQLLDLQDYPGQGSAFVGILDAFMDSKNLIKPNEWKQSCNDIVLLFCTHKFCYTDEENLTGELKISNFANHDIINRSLIWTLTDKLGNIIKKCSIPIRSKQGTLSSVGNLCCSLNNISTNSKLNLKLEISGTKYQNNYDIWVYRHNKDINKGNIYESSLLDSTVISKLKSGDNVLLIPSSDKYQKQTVGALFQTDYWNYRMFKRICERVQKTVSPGTMGLLINNNHPLFAEFPTEFHTNWQWFQIIHDSRPMILDSLQEFKPIVQVIDNIERNHRLGLIFEFSIGKGKLLVCASNLHKNFEKPECFQLYKSIINYMNSESFNPKYKLTTEQLNSIFFYEAKPVNIIDVKNISYE